MEHAEHGDVDNLIKKYKTAHKAVDEKEIWNIVTCSLKGLRDLHKQNIIHRDIKPANLFVCSNKQVKLGDLNVSKMLKNNDLAQTQTGTP
jgi:NIMA (never in mitosis gene a)-related kinase